MRQQYSSYDECIEFFKSAQKSHPDLFRLENIGTTWEGREILLVTISDELDRADEKPALFYTGTIHAREWIGIELAMAYAQHVMDNIDFDPILHILLKRATFYMVPCANPDGFEYSREHFSFWRKNRRQNADGSYGADLNRNFGVGFSPNKNTLSNVYPGPEAFSEPETRALRDFVLSHPNISIALDYHSQGNVIFPAHNFINEDAVDATDLNVLAANMAEQIRKVSGREYGVHMGKPPSSLIQGSGREFYYSTGALSLVVEVGSRNISDYQENMLEHVNENISALTLALEEAPHYDKRDTLKRVEKFVAIDVSESEVTLSWEYDVDDGTYFEIFRSKKAKGFCRSSNRVGMTRKLTFKDTLLDDATNYFYFIRAVDKSVYAKSPFAPVVGVRTAPKKHMFSKILFPSRQNIGYVSEKSSKNRDNFGEKSMFVGISAQKGECFGVIGFSLESVPQNAIIKRAQISIYPMNRVGVQVENFGEWRIAIMDEESCDQIYNFDDVKNAISLGYIDRPVKSKQLSQGVWRRFVAAKQERNIIQNALKKGKIFFRIDGPTRMPISRSSQMMQWEIGFGKYSSGLTFRPKLEVSYTLEPVKLELHSQLERSIGFSESVEDTLRSGFDKSGKRVYGYFEYSLSQVPDVETMVISDAYLELKAQSTTGLSTTRYHIEMVRLSDDGDIHKREVFERIGYDVSQVSLQKEPEQRFVFDTLAIDELENAMRTDEKVSFIIRASSSKNFCKDELSSWMDKKREARPRLIIEYIKKRRSACDGVSNLRYNIEKGRIKLEWNNPKDEAFRGVIVVKNPFHVPSTPYDGQKLYGGSDNYTYDSFGDREIHKFYAVFAYDNVPNFSKVTSLEYGKL